MQTTRLKHLHQCTDTSGYEYTQAAPTGLVLIYKTMTSAAAALKWEPITEAGEKQSWQCKNSKSISVQNKDTLI